MAVSAYDPIARLYDPWSSSVIEDISFYVEEALAAGSGPVVELGVGTGRIAIPTAMAGVHLIRGDSSPEVLAGCRRRGRPVFAPRRLTAAAGQRTRRARHVPIPCVPASGERRGATRGAPGRARAVAAGGTARL